MLSQVTDIELAYSVSTSAVRLSTQSPQLQYSRPFDSVRSEPCAMGPTRRVETAAHAFPAQHMLEIADEAAGFSLCASGVLRQRQ